MPTKRKSPAKKLKVELKNLKPKSDPKGGAVSGECFKAPALTANYCSGLIT
jgi:hypothetical protein